MIELAPLVFEPYLKSVIWGGDKICAYKGIPQPEPDIGESWEISEVPGHISVVASGPYAGLGLDELILRFGAELLGQKVASAYNGKFPLLVKLIDANADLSVQVHPDDRLAQSRHGCPGKTEMWYIIEADPGARIYAGLNTPMTVDGYVESVENGTFMEKLAVHNSRPGDVFFLPAGRVHAIGAGNLLAEIQESSDITYRIYDYDRRDAAGASRELHTELAKDAIDFAPDQNCKNSAPAARDAELVSCEHFTCRRVQVDGDKTFALRPDSFTIVMCIAGQCSLACPGGSLTLRRGHTALIPAQAAQLTCAGAASLLLARA